MEKTCQPKGGTIEFTSLYANDELVVREVRFLIPGEKWSEFETSPMYQQLEEFVRTYGTQETQIQQIELEYPEGTEASPPYSSPPAHSKPFWARVRRRFLEKLLRL